MLKILVRTSQNTFLLHYKGRMANEVSAKEKLFVEGIIRSTQIPYTGRMHSQFNTKTSIMGRNVFNPLNPELNPICYLLELLGAHNFLHVSRIRVKLLTFRLLMSYIYGAPILDVSRSHTTTQHSR